MFISIFSGDDAGVGVGEGEDAGVGEVLAEGAGIFMPGISFGSSFFGPAGFRVAVGFGFGFGSDFVGCMPGMSCLCVLSCAQTLAPASKIRVVIKTEKSFASNFSLLMFPSQNHLSSRQAASGTPALCVKDLDSFVNAGQSFFSCSEEKPLRELNEKNAQEKVFGCGMAGRRVLSGLNRQGEASER
jgi:hypothetical protein